MLKPCKWLLNRNYLTLNNPYLTINQSPQTHRTSTQPRFLRLVYIKLNLALKINRRINNLSVLLQLLHQRCRCGIHRRRSGYHDGRSDRRRCHHLMQAWGVGRSRKMGVSINGGRYPKMVGFSWFMSLKIPLKRMMTGGSPILGNPQVDTYMEADGWENDRNIMVFFLSENPPFFRFLSGGSCWENHQWIFQCHNFIWLVVGPPLWKILKVNWDD